jgi:conjugal transfer mating pair stabilization protein TraN
MRKRLAPMALLVCAGLAHGDPMSEARAVGQGSVDTIYGGINYSGSAWTQDAAQASTGGNAPYGVDPSTASTQGAALQAACASNPASRAECEGLNASADTANSGVYQNAGQIVPQDVYKLREGQLPIDSALADTGIAGAYSACTTQTVTQGQQYFDEQYCHDYYLRVLDQPCTKTLDVELVCESRVVPRVNTATGWYWCGGCAYNRDGQWSTYKDQVTNLLQALGNQTQFAGSLTAGDYWGVVGTGGAAMTFKVNGHAYGTGTSFWYYHIHIGRGISYGICVNNSPTFQQSGCTGAINDSMVDLSGQADCPNPTWRPPTEDYPGHYYCPGATTISCPAGSEAQVIDGNSTCIGDLQCSERDDWQDSCAGYASRVPPGLLPPDGVNPDGGLVPFPVATGPGPKDKCERTTSVCTQPGETRDIDDHPVTRDCWQYTNTFTCLDLDPKSDCDQPRWGSCTTLGTSCIDRDELIPDFCTAEQTRFSCMVADTTREETVTDCGTQVYQDSSGAVWDTGHEPDNDLASVVAFMEAGREAGGYIDPDSLELFKGFDSRCKKKLFGLVNCCNKGGTSSGSMFSNSAIAAVSAGGQAAASTYTFDALFVSDAPNWVINGFSSVFGSGTSSALAGLLAGQVSVESFLTSLIPGPWSIAMLALQFSGLLSCEDRDIETALKRDARLCVDLGGYCSKKVPIIGTCLERTYSHCCFNSLLAKAINTQGKAQLGMGMGSAKQPNCGGFTAAQLQQLDLAAMDLSEFMDQVRPQGVSPTATSCYFQGETSCPAVH